MVEKAEVKDLCELTLDYRSSTERNNATFNDAVNSIKPSLSIYTGPAPLVGSYTGKEPEIFHLEK